MISSNYITLQKQIADECSDNQALLAPLADSTLTLSPIQNAIQSAITKWERELFYFNGFRLEPTLASPFYTVKAQEFYTTTDYAQLANLCAIKSLRVLIANNRYKLDQRDNVYLDEVSVNSTTQSQPTDYTYDAAGMLRLYPIPDNAYPLGILATQKFPALVNPTDTNAWTTEAWDLIRSEAKLILAREVIYDAQLEAASKKAIYGDPANPQERGYLSVLKDETRNRLSKRTKVRPTYF